MWSICSVVCSSVHLKMCGYEVCVRTCVRACVRACVCVCVCVCLPARAHVPRCASRHSPPCIDIPRVSSLATVPHYSPAPFFLLQSVYDVLCHHHETCIRLIVAERKRPFLWCHAIRTDSVTSRTRLPTTWRRLRLIQAAPRK